MKVLCYGAGAVGCLIGGRLAAYGHDVTLLVRPDAAGALRQRGLVLREPNGQVLYARPRVLSDLSRRREKEAPPDLILVAVKAYDVEAAAPSVAPLCGPRTVVLGIQNGLGSEEALAAAVGVERVVSGAFTLSVSVSEPGVLQQHTASGGLALGELQPAEGRLEQLATTFGLAGLRTRICTDWRSMKWSKLLLNMLANASCAILDMTPAEVFRNGRLFRMEQRAFREARRVMRRLHLKPVGLPGYPVRLLCAAMALPSPLARLLLAPRVAGGRGAKVPSLAVDLARGRQVTEVRFLNGAVVAAGSQCRVLTPANACLASTLELVASQRAAREAYRRRPDVLLRELATAASGP